MRDQSLRWALRVGCVLALAMVSVSTLSGCLEVQALLAPPVVTDDGSDVETPPADSTNDSEASAVDEYGPFPPGENDADDGGTDDDDVNTNGDDVNTNGEDVDTNGEDTVDEGFSETLEALADDQVPETLDSGLQIFDFVVGDGASPESLSDRVRVDYAGYILDTGVQFDTGEDVAFNLDGVVPGFGEGVLGMNIGGRRRLFIPPDLGYGESGNSRAGIGGDDVIVFDVVLRSIE